MNTNVYVNSSHLLDRYGIFGVYVKCTQPQVKSGIFCLFFRLPVGDKMSALRLEVITGGQQVFFQVFLGRSKQKVQDLMTYSLPYPKTALKGFKKDQSQNERMCQSMCAFYKHLNVRVLHMIGLVLVICS